MARPGSEILLGTTPNTLSVATDTGTAFMLGQTDRGPQEARLIRSLTEFVSVFGDRVAYSSLYDAVELFFREGGDRVYISRVVGPAASSGSKNLLDGAAAISLVATAVGPGAWSADYQVQVVAGVGAGTFRIYVLDADDNVLEDSGDLEDQLAAVTWSAFSDYIRITLGVSALDPAVAAASALSAGSDDRTNITDDEWQDALDLFTSDYGPGQVLAPGRTSSNGHQQLIAHVEAMDRVALLDLSNTGNEATLQGEAAADRSRFAAAFAPWVVIPGTTDTSERTVPPSAMVAGMIARNDPSLGTNRPSAGTAGISRFATGLSQPGWTDSERETLNANGVNVIRSMGGGIRVYGWRSLASPTSDADWLDFGNARLYMALGAELEAVAENYVFEEIDGQNGGTIGAYHDALAGVCLRHYQRGELFGDTAADAFSVDTGSAVNTLETIAALELHAIVSVRMSPFAEYVPITIIKRQITQAV